MNVGDSKCCLILRWLDLSSELVESADGATPKPYFRGDGRWCTKCAKEVNDANDGSLAKTHYVNKHGIFRFGTASQSSPRRNTNGAGKNRPCSDFPEFAIVSLTPESK